MGRGGLRFSSRWHDLAKEASSSVARGRSSDNDEYSTDFDGARRKHQRLWRRKQQQRRQQRRPDNDNEQGIFPHAIETQGVKLQHSPSTHLATVSTAVTTCCWQALRLLVMDCESQPTALLWGRKERARGRKIGRRREHFPQQPPTTPPAASNSRLGVRIYIFFCGSARAGYCYKRSWMITPTE